MNSFLCRFPRSFGLGKGMLPPWMHSLPSSSSSCVESREGGHEPGLCLSPPPAPCCVWLGGPWTWTHISLSQTFSQHLCTWPLSSMSSKEERKFRERLQAARGWTQNPHNKAQRTLTTPAALFMQVSSTLVCLFQACRPLHAGDDTTSGSWLTRLLTWEFILRQITQDTSFMALPLPPLTCTQLSRFTKAFLQMRWNQVFFLGSNFQTSNVCGWQHNWNSSRIIRLIWTDCLITKISFFTLGLFRYI